MKLSQCMLLLILAVGLSGCSTYSIEGRYSYDSSIDYPSMKYFALLPVDDSAFSTPASAAHYRTAIVQALKSKGFAENSENPDFEIKTHPIGTYREEYVTIYGNMDFPKIWLRVNFLHPSSGTVVFEGVADAHFDEGMSQVDKNLLLDEAMKVILTGFPPGPG
jgi:hypothetical protein